MNNIRLLSDLVNTIMDFMAPSAHSLRQTAQRGRKDHHFVSRLAQTVC
jgi:hypothetical protein